MSSKSALDAQRQAPDLSTALPGPLAQDHVKSDMAVTSPSLPRAYPMVPTRGRGAVLEDIDGNVFLDCNAGIAVNSTGHCHPRVVSAVQRQAEELLHYSASDFYLPIYAEMCDALAKTAPMGDAPVRVFLSNSGTEAVDGALKLVRHATGRSGVISFFGAFHGRSYGALSLTASKAKYHTKFGPLVPNVYHAPYAGHRFDDPENEKWYTIEYLEEVLFRYDVDPHEIAAVFVEPIQGEGGYIVPPAGWMAALHKLCRKYGILLVADEVQSGAGRTGRMWAMEHTGVEPDVLITAKGLASGLPLGGFIARAELMESWAAGDHGSTYGGSPIPCAAGIATLDIIQTENLLDNAAVQGERFRAGLAPLIERHPGIVTDVRGVGLMIGVEFCDGATSEKVQAACFNKGLLVLEAGENVIRMSPPLVITSDQVDTAIELFSQAVAEVANV